MPDFVATAILHVNDVIAGVGPEVYSDAPMRVSGHRLRRRGIGYRADPHVQHAVDRRQEADLLALQSVSRFVAYTLNYARLYEDDLKRCPIC